MSSKDKVKVASGEMDEKRKKKQEDPADLIDRPAVSSKNKKYCVICRSGPSALDMRQKRVAGNRFKIYKKLHASFGFPSAQSTAKEFNFCCEKCFESVNLLHNLQDKPQEAENEIKEVAVKIRNSIRTRSPVNLELEKNKTFGNSVARPNRTRSTAERTTGNCTVTNEVGLNDDIKIEIKMEDKIIIKEEVVEKEIDDDEFIVDNSLMEDDSVNWDGCIICRNRPSAFDMKNKRQAERRFEIYEKLDTSYQLPTAESTKEEFRYCCETCFKAVDHLHNLQVNLEKVQAEIKAIVASINTSILSRTLATLGKQKIFGDCRPESAGRRNRSKTAAAERKNENFMIGDRDDGFIKVEIKDKVKKEIIKQETTDHDNNFMEQEYVDQSQTRSSSVLDKEVGRRKSSGRAAAGKEKRNSTSDIEDSMRTEEIEDKIKTVLIEEVNEEVPENDFISEDTLIEKGNVQSKLIPATSTQMQVIYALRSRRMPRLVLVKPVGNDNTEPDDFAIENSTPPLLTRQTTPSENNLADNLFATKKPGKQLKESLVPSRKITSAKISKTRFAQQKRKLKNSPQSGNRKSKGLLKPLPVDILLKKNHQKKRKCKKQLECYFCGKKCIYQSKLFKHLTKHTFEKPYKCGSCEARFCGTSSRIRHVSVVHEGKKPFKCAYNDCFKRFSTKANLMSHKRSHTKDKPFKCYLCELSFHSNFNRFRHINSIHKKLKPHKCTRQGCICRFSTSQHLRHHINAVHKGLKPFKCTVDGCRNRYVQKGHLITHMQIHEKKPFVCDKCQRRFLRKSSFIRHQNKSVKKCKPPNTN